jgi:hypothetical protein
MTKFFWTPFTVNIIAKCMQFELLKLHVVVFTPAI